MNNPEVVAHWNLSDMKVCLNCEQACLATNKACPCCTGSKLVWIGDLRRTIMRWAEGQEAKK